MPNIYYVLDTQLSTLSCLILATPWTVARQTPLSMDSPGKNTEVGCRFLLQAIFLTQGLNLHHLHWDGFFYHWATREKPQALYHLN